MPAAGGAEPGQQDVIACIEVDGDGSAGGYVALLHLVQHVTIGLQVAGYVAGIDTDGQITVDAINDVRNASLTVIVDARITGNQWYLYAAPGVVDTFEYAYLEGEQGVFTETREGFEVDGMEIKARLVFGAAWIDYRGTYKNPGA